MDSFTTFEVFESSGKMSYKQLDDIVDIFERLEGIALIKWNPNQFEIEYYPNLYSKTFLEDELKKIGISLKKDKKNLLSRFLDKIAKDNRESFGNRKLDCCSLNRAK